MKFNSVAGFTLLELLIYVAVLSIVALVVTSVAFSYRQGERLVGTRAAVGDNLQFALAKITGDLFVAASVTMPAAAGDISSTLALGDGGSQISYFVSADKLWRQVGGNSPVAITSDDVRVAAASFTRMENHNPVLDRTTVSVTVNLEVVSLDAGFPYSEKKQTTAALQ